MTPPKPGLHSEVNPVESRSRTNTSLTEFESLPTRLLAKLSKATYRPFPEIQAYSLAAFPCVPLEERLVRSVVPATQSRTKESETPFESPPTRLLAALRKAA